jgi:putative hemolysin
LVDGHYSFAWFLTYFELDELINDYEVTTVSGLIMTELSYIQNKEKNWFGKIWIKVIDMDGVKIDKVVKALKRLIVLSLVITI